MGAPVLCSSNCMVPENIHTTPTEGICRMTSLPSGFSKISPQNLHPFPPEFPKFSHTPWKNCYLTRMPNFVSFILYFLLNCITDKRIPYTNSLCAQITDKFCEFHVFSVKFYNGCEFLLHSSHEEIVEKFLATRK